MTLRVETGFATGNGVLREVGEDHVTIDRDLRDSTGDRWYWHVRLRAPTDRPVRVSMARSSLLGRYGPALSEGGSYDWLRAHPGPDTHFDLSLTAGVEVGLAATVPYGPHELRTFRRRTPEEVRWEVFTTTENHRPVPMLRIRPEHARFLVILTARHHACEAMASYVLEGAVDRFIELRRADAPAVRQCELIAVPMMDMDGVWRGDQGKARVPWDHNRDYGKSGSRYHSVAALRELLSGEDRPVYAVDLHTPGLRGPLEERPYVVASGDPGDAERAADLRSTFSLTDPVDACNGPEVLVFDEDWNSATSSSRRCCAAWLRSRPSTRLACTVEYPNAVIHDHPVRPPATRRFGAALMQALVALM